MLQEGAPLHCLADFFHALGSGSGRWVEGYGVEGGAWTRAGGQGVGGRAGVGQGQAGVRWVCRGNGVDG